jgi:hypothetical protein
LSRVGVCVWLIRRGLDWLIYCTLCIHNSELQAIQRYRWSTHFPVHRCTRTRVLSLHLWYPGNGFITVSLLLRITHEVFFSQPNFFLAIILQLPTQFSSSAPKLISWQAGVSKSALFSRLYCCSVVRVRVTLRLTVSQSVCVGVEPRLGLMTRYLFFIESYSSVHMGRPLWREVGSVISTAEHGPHRKRPLLLSRRVSDPLSSSGCLNVACVCSRRNVFTESLTSNGSIRHNIPKK